MPPKTPKEQLGVDMDAPTAPVQVEAPAGVDDGSQEEDPQRPEWLPDNFKDEKEFASAYKEAQNKIREEGERSKRLEGQIANLTQVVEGLQPQQQQSSTDDGNMREQLQAAYENDPIGTIAYLAQQAAGQTVDQRLGDLQRQNDPAVRAQMEAQNQLLAMSVDRALGDRFDDWGDFRDKVGEEIRSDPNLLTEQILQSPEATTRALTRIYENLKARDILERVENGTLDSSLASSQMKRQAQTVTGGGVRQGAPDASDAHMARLQAAAKGISYSAYREGK